MYNNIANLKFLKTLVCGYKIVYLPKHPNANKTGGWVYYHRLVMENRLKRYLEKDEHVHHKDENKLNNNIDNLELLSSSEHSRLHKGEKEVKICKHCKKEFIYKHSGNLNIFCSLECSSQSHQKIIWPSIEELELQLKNKSMLQLSKELGVSDNAIRKHIKKYKNK